MSRLFLWFVFSCAGLFSACQSNNAPPANAAGLQPPPSFPVASYASKPLSPTGPGIIISSWASKEVLAFMNEGDRLWNRQAELRALTGPIAQQVTWKNPDNNHSGNIVPVKDTYSAEGLYCREFRETVFLGNVQRDGSSTACQERDGTWVAARRN